MGGPPTHRSRAMRVLVPPIAVRPRASRRGAAAEHPEGWQPVPPKSLWRPSPPLRGTHRSSCLDSLDALVMLRGVLNPASPLPLYQRLAELLNARIARSEPRPGRAAAVEPELSRAHRIGRPTVRMALDVLSQRGLVERRRGSGTYVREAPRRVDLFSLAGTLSSFRQGGVRLETILVKRARLCRVEHDADNPFPEREAYTFTRLGKDLWVSGAPQALVSGRADLPRFQRWLLSPGASLSRLVEEALLFEAESRRAEFSSCAGAQNRQGRSRAQGRWARAPREAHAAFPDCAERNFSRSSTAARRTWCSQADDRSDKPWLNR